MILIEINGTRLSGFKRISIEKSLDDLAGTFSFTAISGNAMSFPAKVNDTCKIFIDESQVITGFIEGIEGHSDKDSQDVVFSGRDRTADIVDSTIGTNIEFKAPISLIDIAKRTLKSEGITGIDVYTNLTDLTPFTTNELTNVSAEIGKGIFEFIETYARMKQVLMTTDHVGNIVFTRTPKDVPQITLIRKKNDINRINNVMSSNWIINNSKRFNQYRFQSQASMGDFINIKNFNAASAVSILSSATDNEIRKTRILNVIAEQPGNTNAMKNRATWEGSVRKARALEYRPRLVGFYPPNFDDDIWRVNSLVKIIDDYASINATMLVNKVSFESTLDGGNVTELTCVPKDSYTLDLEISSVDQKANKTADNYITIDKNNSNGKSQ